MTLASALTRDAFRTPKVGHRSEGQGHKRPKVFRTQLQPFFNPMAAACLIGFLMDEEDDEWSEDSNRSGTRQVALTWEE
jgi:hypothetical protein